MNSKAKKIMMLALAVSLSSGCASNSNIPQGNEFQVNPFLWRAALEVISFAPIATTDPTGGVITTSWHDQPKQPNERFQFTIYILDRALRADALKVSVFRQTRTGRRGWRTAASTPKLARSVEDLILTRARALRLSYETSR